MLRFREATSARLFHPHGVVGQHGSEDSTIEKSFERVLENLLMLGNSWRPTDVVIKQGDLICLPGDRSFATQSGGFSRHPAWYW
jgi:hypothetical protein